MNAGADLVCQRQGGLFEIALNRPGRLNALTPPSAQALLQAVRQGQDDPAVRLLLIRGEGRAFCAGKDRDAPASAAFVATLQQLAAALVDGKPAIAAVQGWAVGAGLELALNCDVVFASEDARFALPEAQLGLPGTGGIHALLPRLIGLGRAKALLWSGQAFGARQAHDWGLVWQLTPPGALLDEARAFGRLLEQAEPDTLARVKALLHAAALRDFDATLVAEGR
ncbi:MAG: enoyl-CoA hydratase/isomerase family protein [Burkholderiales bacterium]|nr:enoyl-CoA hydratase/isomerase family protein [Burkholderiales bacterium]